MTPRASGARSRVRRGSPRGALGATRRHRVGADAKGVPPRVALPQHPLPGGAAATSANSSMADGTRPIGLGSSANVGQTGVGPVRRDDRSTPARWLVGRLCGTVPPPMLSQEGRTKPGSGRPRELPGGGAGAGQSAAGRPIGCGAANRLRAGRRAALEATPTPAGCPPGRRAALRGPGPLRSSAPAAARPPRSAQPRRVRPARRPR